jgi:hypothetical protein
MAAVWGFLAKAGIWVANILGIGIIWKWMFPSEDSTMAVYVALGFMTLVVGLLAYIAFVR